MLPSMRRGALFRIRYYVEVGVKAKDLLDFTLTRRVNIFPALDSSMLPSKSGAFVLTSFRGTSDSSTLPKGHV